jgi:dipeptidyl aminopeptidase/acylaminoacyl peptidase
VFSADGTRLVTNIDNSRPGPTVWDTRTGDILLELKGIGQVRSVAFSPDGTRLVTGSLASPAIAKVWDARTGKILLELKGHGGWVNGVAFSPDGTRIVTGSDDATARVWDARTGKSLREFMVPATGFQLWDVTFSPDGARIATGSVAGTASVWDARTGTHLLYLKGLTRLTSVAFSPDGMRLLTGGDDHSAKVWDARTGALLLDLKGGYSGEATSVAFSPDGTRIVTGTKVWDARTGTPLLDLKGVALSPNWTRLVTKKEGDPVRIIDLMLPSPAEEGEYRLYWTRPRPDLHREEYAKAVQAQDTFAAGFHLDRLLAYEPAQRDALLRQRTTFLETTLKQDAQNAGARLLLARTAWHSPALGSKDTAALLPAADDKGLLARRTRGGLLLRLKKADEAVPVLEAALKERGDDQPPVEELLLAWAYHETKQADKAKEMWTKATAWLDRQPEAVRDNAFDWETWYESAVLRRELAPHFTAQKP